jgi:hypothetical protein
MEGQCDFIGPAFTLMKGILFVRVAGNSYANQTAYWQ